MLVYKIWWAKCYKYHEEDEETGQELKKKHSVEVSQLFFLRLQFFLKELMTYIYEFKLNVTLWVKFYQQRHRMVNETLKEELATGVHALSIQVIRY